MVCLAYPLVVRERGKITCSDANHFTDIDVLHFLSGGRSQRVNAMGGLVLYGDVTENRQTEPPNLNKASRAVEKASLQFWPPAEQKNLSRTIDVEDVSMMQMVCDNGIFLCYQQCMFTPDYWRNYTGTQNLLLSPSLQPPRRGLMPDLIRPGLIHHE